MKNIHPMMQVFIAMDAIGLSSGPGWSWAHSIDYHTDLMPILIVMGAIGLVGAVLTIAAMLLAEAMYIIYMGDAAIENAGVGISPQVGILTGLIFLGAGVIAGVVGALEQVQGGAPVWQIITMAIASLMVVIFGLAITAVYNRLEADSRPNGDPIFF